MTVPSTKLDVSWKNYFKPTPKNVLRIAEGIQGILLGMSTLSMFGTYIEKLSIWYGITFNIAIIIVNQGVKFIAGIVHDMETETAVVEFPSGDEVIITKPVPHDGAEQNQAN